MTSESDAPALYKRRWTRPKRCSCGKPGVYPNEPAALGAADRLGEKFEVPFRAYRCPGTSVWHLATRGFSPQALQSRPRLLAWHLSARGGITRAGLLQEMGIEPYSRQSGKLMGALTVFVQLGLATVDDRGYVYAADRAGLTRVMAAGLEDYAASRGVSIRR